MSWRQKQVVAGMDMIMPVLCEECRQEFDDGYYYDIDGCLLCGDCMDKLFRRVTPLEETGDML